MATDTKMDKETLERLYKRSFDEPELGNELFPPSIYYRFLKLLASEMKSKLSVELGVSGGGGSLHLALGNLAGITVGIDIMTIPERQHTAIEMMVGDAFRFFRGDGIKSASLVHDLYGTVDILFIDTVHTKEQTWKELKAWQPYLSDDYVVCFDDLLRPEMRGFWGELPEPKMRMDKLHDGAENGGGFGVIWK